MKTSSVIIAVAIAILSVSLWALANRPEQEPPWPQRIQGFSFSPFQSDQSPLDEKYPSAKQLEADLDLLKGKTHAIRTYTVEATLAKIPELAQKDGMNVALGVWIDDKYESNEADLKTMEQIVKTHFNIVRVIIGNEAVLRNDVPIEKLIGYLDRERTKLGVPISTAEPWHTWLKHPELADHVDYLAVHMLPYWEGVRIDRAVDYIVDKIDLLKKRFPGKPIVIAEVGWPSNGRTRKWAVASPANEAIFLRQFLDRAKKENYTYYLMEAFDQPWKKDTEGAVGAYWGVYDVHRQEKFPFTEPIVPIENWYILAGISVLIAVVAFAILLIDSHTLGNRGRSFLGVLVFAAASGVVWVIYDYASQYLTVGTVLVGLVMVCGMMGVIVVLLTEAHEWAEARWITRWRRPFKPVEMAETDLPMVSVHVPIHDEPPDMVIATLNGLAGLDYPRFEVLVVDNNTKDPQVWQPVRAYCQKLGVRFRFFHVDPLPGFKAGALNFALARTRPDAQIVAVIDSDYIVSKNWLKDLVPQFKDPEMGIVQAPQDYRDAGASLFKAMCYAEYRGFFFIGMMTRNERNAIIQHGTMTMIRREVLQDLGGWAEWCITEDAELGLRIFEKGYLASYNAQSYGRGLMPDTFGDYKKQRYRWAYGAMQILRRHATYLISPKKTKLTAGQCYHFFAGWLPWLADGVNLLFNLAALCWSVAMLLDPLHFDPPIVIFSLLPLSLFVFKVGKLFYLYRTRLKTSMGQTIAAAVAGLALSHTIAKAVLAGFVTRDKPFFRTPKLANTSAILKVLAACVDELFMMGALSCAAITIGATQKLDTLDIRLWVMVLAMQSLPYGATLLMALISALPQGRKNRLAAAVQSSDADSGPGLMN
jgi:exo-beta-1,3-glucanase (GH17 family)/cellulose synthase/poly-beta-1,6-N-acetylglucosamine synthase-like glycosyltransferase